MTFGRPGQDEPAPVKSMPGNQRAVFLETLGRTIGLDWRELYAEVSAAEGQAMHRRTVLPMV